MIPIYKPYIKKYNNNAIKAINDEWISNHGIYINLASDLINKIFGVKYSILMNNGTSATHCLLLSIKYKYPNIKKIYIPNNVFIAPLNCTLKEYGPDNIEILKSSNDNVNFCLDEDYLLSLDKNSAILIVHNLGYIIDIDKIKRIRPDIVLVEDNCEGIFGKYNNKYSGTDTLCSSLSFYGNKTITSGEGGCYMTNDIELYKYIKMIYSHGMSNIKYIHDDIGYNYRMTNIQAAFLYDQLMDYNSILNLKKNIFKNYNDLINQELKDYDVYRIKDKPNTENSHWMYVLFINNLNFNHFEKYLLDNEIQIRPLFYDIREHKYIKNSINIPYEKNLLFNNGFMLPSYPELTFEEQKYIISTIKNYIITFLTNKI